jgi:hypothetical protein
MREKYYTLAILLGAGGVRRLVPVKVLTTSGRHVIQR